MKTEHIFSIKTHLKKKRSVIFVAMLVYQRVGGQGGAFNDFLFLHLQMGNDPI